MARKIDTLRADMHEKIDMVPADLLPILNNRINAFIYQVATDTLDDDDASFFNPFDEQKNKLEHAAALKAEVARRSRLKLVPDKK